jgi:hypothetical protein
MKKVYIAGKMVWLDKEDSYWRSSIRTCPYEGPAEVQISEDVKLLLPFGKSFDHGGDTVEGICETDLELLESCDFVVAFFTHPNQVGTIVELLHALHLGKPCLAVFVSPMVSLPTDPKKDEGRGPKIIAGKLYSRGESDNYWFLINYLLEYSRATCVAVESQEEGIYVMHKWIEYMTHAPSKENF